MTDILAQCAAAIASGELRVVDLTHTLDPDFPASPANRWSRGYIRHLLAVGEPAAARIVTLHNLA